jgi:2'-5' RNA ligase
MRLFVALEVPEGPRREAEARVRKMRRELPPARWVDLSNVHLTLIFLGAIDDARVEALAAELARACAPHRPFSLRLAGGGTFPPRRPARVAWVGVDSGAGGAVGPELAALHADVAAATHAALREFPIEERPYHPHVTLARCPEPWSRSAAESFAAAFAGPLGEPFTAARAVLVESRLGHGGARHHEIASFPFAAGGA